MLLRFERSTCLKVERVPHARDETIWAYGLPREFEDNVMGSTYTYSLKNVIPNF
jgi:hypothetical protein